VEGLRGGNSPGLSHSFCSSAKKGVGSQMSSSGKLARKTSLVTAAPMRARSQPFVLSGLIPLVANACASEATFDTPRTCSISFARAGSGAG